jgi:predicted nucleotidyltransferase component of viral defense system
MTIYIARQCVELFHLLFLNQLSRKLDRQCHALKGGANMRFFFKSPRYSDDIDFDIQAIRVDALKKKVNSILDSNPFHDILQTRNLKIEHITEHKQTETTQRWKLGLTYPLIKGALPTKIEFSRRRRLDSPLSLEPIAAEILRMYEMPFLMVSHYQAESAFKQKIDAIISRSETQARDIFDLYLLLTSRLEKIPRLEKQRADLNKARENILSTDFAAFKSQVISYLEPEVQKQYDSEDVWDGMRLKVVETLERTVP